MITTQKKTYKISLVEDDVELAKMIKSFLISEGFGVTWVDDGIKAVQHILSDQPDLVVLDIMLPELNGIEVCRQIRKEFNNPVLMLTAKDDDFTEVSALNTGADGYLNKPVRPHILLAHINALLRRNQNKSIRSDTVQIQNLSINLKSYTLQKDGEEIILTSGEFELLTVLVKSNGVPVSRDSLYQQLRGIEYDGLDRSIDLRVSSLRKKLDDDTPPYRFIKTVRGKGYLLVV
ncbi:MAG: response regulator transcription factor [Cocleimonas sp.]